jgi:hypothetical protein
MYVLQKAPVCATMIDLCIRKLLLGICVKTSLTLTLTSLHYFRRNTPASFSKTNESLRFWYVRVAKGPVCATIRKGSWHLSELRYRAKKKALIHYYMGEDAADNIRSDVSTEGVQKNVSLASFCELEYDDERNELNDLAQVLLKIARGERKPKDNVKSAQ